jgi:hypothetical protein
MSRTTQGWVGFGLIVMAAAFPPPTLGGAAYIRKVYAYGANGPGPILNGHLVDFIWAPGQFVIPDGSKNHVLGGTFDSNEDYVYGMDVVNDARGTTPVSRFIFSNGLRQPIDSYGWIDHSILAFNIGGSAPDNIFNQGLPRPVPIQGAAVVGGPEPAQINFQFAQPIPDFGDPTRPINDDYQSDVFYITSPLPPVVVTTGIMQFDGPVLDFKVGNDLAPNVPEPAGIVLFGIGVAAVLVCLAHRQGRKQRLRSQPA